ncbi:purine-nucleoside phosphorylase [Salisediminibacterium halotolerans]|uniref:purine-nucleoside phosphorylase n=1 Tax=Salisediminibacterium halotolerans TaxID=517425 RepID=UPI000EB24CD1|nr:purine-nucleoside phosphorylase [Salisediminibacterium halotolerans]RLJ78006.1 purine-nucleoside phosphorylase [Actinophytocola xinjiangensis]RPE88656.1 purine-nucleoside phosphorylase [Salisediminibacterium halotolerans]TWG36983.1 purine-nucleoside phosphorylase [Salisediminibacterium halotolerans]GEL08482.1 purine nucleoside phosphorylase [Salisediminibacterium halotolerans]
MDERVLQAKAWIEKHLKSSPSIGLILGSGLGVLANEITDPVKLDYADIPGFPESTVAGHEGRLIIGELEGKTVVAMQGRFHYYEGHDMSTIVLPVRVMQAIGVEKLIVTNAAGGVNEAYQPGDLMIINDHINWFGTNPLIGPNAGGVRFPDMSKAYSPELIAIAQQTAEELDIRTQNGVYVGNTGPAYETPAEVRMMRIIGGDAVGMSTVPEVIAARHAELDVLGVSCISNMAAGILDQPLTHDEVIETTEQVKADFLRFIKAIIQKIN